MLALLWLLLALAARTASAGFVICTTTAASVPTYKTAGSNDACVAACEGFVWSFYKPGTCACSNNAPSNAVAGVTPATAPPSSCPSGGFILATSFVYNTCATTITPNLLDTGNLWAALTTVSGPDACFAQCRSSIYALLWPGAGGIVGWRCVCLTYAPLVIPIFSCNSNSLYLYQHTLPQATAGIARRAARPRITDGPELYCPPGREPCRVGGEGYECLDVQSELCECAWEAPLTPDSCGGCLHGSMVPSVNQTVGVDCTTLDGVHHQGQGVTCFEGKCQVQACAPGFFAVDGACRRRR
ncbi:hypothetical protein Q8F55_004921 [Vanrija albida]|uniref:Protein CPL1-like domain-containing protein n=1 Tax=Vanrija albida TaxID=181172 RepID=A0ABR3Q0E7_9TREE